MFSSLTGQDVFWAAIIAFAVTWVIKVMSSLFKMVITHSTEFEFSLHNKIDVIQRCYEMFPTDHISFNGEIFRRGMQVCVITLRHKKYEGRFMGISPDNMVCVMTDRSVVAQELDTIDEIFPV